MYQENVFFKIDKRDINGVGHIRPPPPAVTSVPPPPYPQIPTCELYSISFVSKLEDSIVLNLVSAYIHKKYS